MKRHYSLGVALERFIIQALYKLKVITVPCRIEYVKTSIAHRSWNKEIALISVRERRPQYEMEWKRNVSLRECIIKHPIAWEGKKSPSIMERKCAVIRPHANEAHNFLSALTFRQHILPFAMLFRFSRATTVQ